MRELGFLTSLARVTHTTGADERSPMAVTAMVQHRVADYDAWRWPVL
jgi:hypothetical protein